MQESFYGKPSSNIFITTIYETLNDLISNLDNLLVSQYFIVNEDYNEVTFIEVGVTDVTNYYTRTGSEGSYIYTKTSDTVARKGTTYYSNGNAGVYKIVLEDITKTYLKITQFVGASGSINFLGYFDELPTSSATSGDACFILEEDAVSGSDLYNFYFYTGTEWQKNNLFSEKIDDNIVSTTKTFSSDKIIEYFEDNGLSKRHEDDIVNNIIVDDGYYKLSAGLTKNKLELILANLEDPDLFKINFIESDVTDITWTSKITNGLYLLENNIYNKITDFTLTYDSTISYYEIELKSSGVINYYKYILEFVTSIYYTKVGDTYTLDTEAYDSEKIYYYIKEIILTEDTYIGNNYYINSGSDYTLAIGNYDSEATYYDIFEVILFNELTFDYDLTNGLFIKYKNYHVIGRNREYLYGHSHGNISHNGYFIREDVEQTDIPFYPVITNSNSELDFCTPQEFNSLIGEIFISDQTKITINENATEENANINIILDEDITFNQIEGALIKVFFESGVSIQKSILLTLYDNNNLELVNGQIKYDNRTGVYDADAGTFKFDANFIPAGHVAIFIYRIVNGVSYFELLNPMYIGTHSHYIKTIGDIEYGTWTPVLTDGGSTSSSIKDSAIVSSHNTDPTGWYQRIGNLVTIGFNLFFTPNSQITNEDGSEVISLSSIPIGISGIPYNCKENAGGGGVIYNIYIGNSSASSVSTGEDALNKLVSYGIIQTKEYWTNLLAEGSVTYLELLLKNMANYILKTSKYPSCFYLKALTGTSANDDNVIGVRLSSVNSDNTCNLSYGYYNSLNKSIKLIGTLTYYTDDDFGTYISDNVIVTDPATTAKISEIKNLISAMDELISSANEQLQLS